MYSRLRFFGLTECCVIPFLNAVISFFKYCYSHVTHDKVRYLGINKKPPEQAACVICPGDGVQPPRSSSPPR